MKKKIRILQFTVAASKGGRTQYILNLWNKIDHSKYAFDFVTFSKELDFEYKLKTEGCNVYHVKNYPEDNREAFISEFKDILANNYDVIEVHTSYWKDTIVEELAKECGIKRIIIHGHSTGITQITANNRKDEEKLTRNHYKVKKRIDQNLATDYWACSEECAEWLFRPSIPSDRIRIIPNTIDVERFQLNTNCREVLKNKYGAEDSFVIGFVGRLEPSKNIPFLFEIFAEIRNETDQVKMLMVGEGSQKQELLELADSKCIVDDIIFTGMVDNVQDYLQAMDVFVMPSYFEGFSISSLEAQCTGLKCLVSDNLPESVGVTDLLKRIKLDKSEWVDEIKSIMNGYERTDRSAELKSKGFDTGVFIKELEAKYAK